MTEFYEWLINIDSLDFGDKSVLVIGGSELAKQYSLALLKMNVSDITIISKTGKNISEFCKDYKIRSLTGGFEKHLPTMDKMDLVIIATPIPTLISATELALEYDQNNILVEKPGSLYYEKLLLLKEKIDSQRVRIAYNRLVYPSFHKLKQLVEKDGGISSCRFTFTEWINRIDFKKDEPEVYDLWGISNSLHVISTVAEMIGMPLEIYPFQYGKLDWHKAGSIFVGSGITENKIPFSYHADWESGGRWSIEVMTHKNSYQLIPLEQLYVCPKGTGKLKAVELKVAFADLKPGIAEEIAVMLSDNIEQKIGLISLDKASNFNKLAEKIFGYNTRNK